MFISFIVPIYNSQEFIAQCLDSLINQNISDYEIICINDGSTDNSGIILDGYCKKHNNIIVKHKPNSGVSASRNEGINIAQGEYLWFVDADDFIAPNILNKLKQLAASCNSDRITVESFSFDTKLETEQTEGLKPNVPYKKVMATRTLYKREYLKNNGIIFTEGVHYGEDGLFNYQTLIHNPQTTDSNILAYFYRVHNLSVTNAPKKQRVKVSLGGSKLVFDILVKDYNNKICLSETRRMLLYWMYGILDFYTILGSDYFNNSFIWEYNLIDIPYKDFELKKLHKELLKISKTHNYKKLVNLNKKKKKRDNRKRNIQKNKKIIIGYIKHPKRLLAKLMSK